MAPRAGPKAGRKAGALDEQVSAALQVSLRRSSESGEAVALRAGAGPSA